MESKMIYWTFLAVICAIAIDNRQFLFSEYVADVGWSWFSKKSDECPYKLVTGNRYIVSKEGIFREKRNDRRRVEEDAKAARAIERCRVVPAGARVNNGLRSLLRAGEKFIGLSSPCIVNSPNESAESQEGIRIFYITLAKTRISITRNVYALKNIMHDWVKQMKLFNISIFLLQVQSSYFITFRVNPPLEMLDLSNQIEEDSQSQSTATTLACPNCDLCEVPW